MKIASCHYDCVHFPPAHLEDLVVLCYEFCVGNGYVFDMLFVFLMDIE